MGATVTDELRSVVGVAGLTRADLAELQRRAARAAFLPADERAALESRIDSWADPVAGDRPGRSAR